MLILWSIGQSVLMDPFFRTFPTSARMFATTDGHHDSFQIRKRLRADEALPQRRLYGFPSVCGQHHHRTGPSISPSTRPTTNTRHPPQFLNTFFVYGMTFCSPLILALAYYWSAFSAPGMRVNFFIAQFPVKFLPWIMLLMTLVQGGNVLLDLTGIVASHAYLFLTEIWPEYGGGSNWLKTPGDVVEGWYQIAERAMALPAPPPQRHAPRAAAVPGGSVGVGGAPGASGSNFFGGGSGWSHRGQGHKLGS